MESSMCKEHVLEELLQEGNRRTCGRGDCEGDILQSTGQGLGSDASGLLAYYSTTGLATMHALQYPGNTSRSGVGSCKRSHVAGIVVIHSWCF